MLLAPTGRLAFLLLSVSTSMALPQQSQMFLQGMIAVRALSAKKTALLYNECGKSAVEHCGVTRPRSVEPDGTGLDAVADGINQKLARFGLQLKTIYSPWEDDKFWGIVNIANDSAARFASEMGTNKLNFFFGLVNELLAEAEITLTSAQNSCLKYNLRVAEAGQTLQNLHRDQWLKIQKREGQGSMIVFGVRSLLELPDVRGWAMNRAAQLRKRASSNPCSGSDNENESSDGDDSSKDGDDSSGDSITPVTIHPKRRRLKHDR